MDRLRDAAREAVGSHGRAVALELEPDTPGVGRPDNNPRRSGRRLAGLALHALGGPADATVGGDPAGCPLWPVGFVGSISHADGYSAVLVARSEAAAAVGIDLERVGRIGAEMWPSIFTPAEMLALRAGAPPPAVAATVLFSAKEAVQKARYAHCGAWTELSRFGLRLDWPATRFVADGPSNGTGRFTVGGPMVLTTFLIDRPAAPSGCPTSSSAPLPLTAAIACGRASGSRWPPPSGRR